MYCIDNSHANDDSDDEGMMVIMMMKAMMVMMTMVTISDDHGFINLRQLNRTGKYFMMFTLNW